MPWPSPKMNIRIADIVHDCTNHVEYFSSSLYTLNLSTHGLSSLVLRKHDILLPWIVPRHIMVICKLQESGKNPRRT